MISAFKHIRLSGHNLTPLTDQNIYGGQLSGTRLAVNQSGIAYVSELLAISGNLQAKIDTANADVSSINGLQNAVNITSRDGIQVFVEGQDIVVSGNDQAVQSSITSVADNLVTTGSTLQTNLSNYSGFASAEYVRKSTQQAFNTNVPQGVEFLNVLFPVEFSSTPRVNVTLETAGTVMYMVSVRDRSVSGYFADFSDVIGEGSVVLNTFASNQ